MALGSRRRRVDPLVVGVAIVALTLFAAVLKPRDIATRTGQGSAIEAAGPSAAAGGPSQPPAAVEVRPAAASAPLAWSDIAAIVRPRDAWGVRAIVRTTGPAATRAQTSYDERWAAFGTIWDEVNRATVEVGDGLVVGLGITFPDGSTPLDLRIWRRNTRGSLSWLDARTVGRIPAQGGFILVPPADAPGAPVWGPGEYRIDALVGGGTIEHFEVDIPDRYENVRLPSSDPPSPSELVAPTEVDPGLVPPGPFATLDRIGVPLGSVGGAPLDAAAAWLETDPGSGRAPVNQVAVAYLPRATGIGVRLPDGAAVRAASLTRLAPDRFPGGSVRIGGGIIDRRRTDPWVLFAAGGRDAWEAGVYRIEVTWAERGGLHEAAWHVELRPGPDTGPPPLLAMTRAWARYAGGSGIVVGRAEPLEGGPRSSAIRLLGTAPGSPPGDPPGPASACAGTTIDGNPEAFGLSYPPGDPVRVSGVQLDDLGPQAAPLTTLLASDVVPGLSLIAPTDGATFRAGVYRLSVRSAIGSHVLTLCVGSTQPR